MTVYDEALNAIRGAGIEADALCRDGLAARYAIVRLTGKTAFTADDAPMLYAYDVETRVFAKDGLDAIALTVEDAMRTAGFTFNSRSDQYDGEYQIATIRWTTWEE